MARRIRVFHVEDYQIIRDGVGLILAQDPELEAVGGTKNGEELWKALETVDFDVLILDLYLDAMEDLKTINGFQICRQMTRLNPDIKILVLTVYDDADRVVEIFKAGALGFVSKKSGYKTLIEAVKAVSRGEKFICPETAAKLRNIDRFLEGVENLKAKYETFSHREKEVLDLLAIGKTSKNIAAQLFITERTVETHRKNMMQKANVKNTVELITYSMSMGILKKVPTS
jgi:DNA-binding NarL/FixJ family response regulator